MVKKFLDGYCKGCRESNILTKISEVVFYSIGVVPHNADKRHPLDRFYLFLWLFNFSYMGGLIYSYLIFPSLQQWIIDFMAYVVVTAYAGSIVTYTVENLKAKRQAGYNKKRAGHIIVYSWITLSLTLSAVLIFTTLDYNIMLRTMWVISIGTLTALVTANRITKMVIRNNGNANNASS